MRYVRWLGILLFFWALAPGVAHSCRDQMAQASFSRDAWLLFLEKAAREGASWEETGREGALFTQLRDPDDRAWACARLREAYSSAYSKKHAATVGHLGPRRVLDSLVSFAADAAQAFVEHKSATDALDAYFSRVRALIQDPAHPARGQYSAGDVFAVARALQEQMRKAGTRLPKEAPLDLYGSFPNGRADLARSDLDLRTHQIAFLTPLWVYGYQAVRELFRGRADDLNLSFAFSPAFSQGLVESEIARVGPVLVRVMPERIECVVYPSVASGPRVPTIYSVPPQ